LTLAAAGGAAALAADEGAPRPGPAVGAAAGPAAARIEAIDLRCEYLADPLGIDARRPRLSWRLAAKDAAARGLRQTAYRLLVSSSPEKLARDEGDLWDSGDVVSEQSVHVVYAGRPLGSGAECCWKVRVRDQAGAVSAWSRPARWTMGLLEPGDWTAQWIGAPVPARAATAKRTAGPKGTVPFSSDENRDSPRERLPDPWLRKVFTLPAAPQRAAMWVASIGYHELYVNGRKVGDAVLAPAVSDHGKRARYVTYEIADCLRAGRNVIGVWLGTGWSAYPFYKRPDRPPTPIVLAQADIALPGGQTRRIVSDATWKTHPSPSTLLGAWNFMNFGGELYDAGRELPAAPDKGTVPVSSDETRDSPRETGDSPQWCQPELDDSAWQAAAVCAPKLILSAQMVEPNRRVKAIRPVAVEEQPGGQYRVDMGVNFAGFVEADLRGPPGKRIELEFSERSEQPMTHKLRSAYVLGPAGQGTFRNRFNYAVGRWITVKGLEAKPELADFRGYLVRTDYRRAADFECSNPLLNDIYRTTLWTFENLSLGGYVVDCPQRERMGYGGDAHATTETALNSYQLGAFYTKWAQDWRDVQGNASAWGIAVKSGPGAGGPAEEGNLPYTAPTYWGGGGPAWCGFCVTLPWLVYRQYGDVRILEEGFPTIQRWLAFLESKSADDMLVRWGGQWDFLGDWLWPGAQGVNGDTPETLFFNNCYWIYNLETAARIADVLARPDAADAYRRRAERVRRAVHAKFFRPDENSYVDGSQAYLAIALAVDLPPPALRGAVWKRLQDEILVKRKGHIHAGITGGYFVIKTLVEAGRDDLLYEMVSKDDYPGWGDMLRRGASTLWESWEGGDLSRLHSSYLHVGLWFIEGLAGIRPDRERPGFQSIVIRPGVLPGRLEWVRARYESLYGPIAVAWKIEGGKLHTSIVVPPGCTARLLLPATDAGSVRESGRPAARSPGVKPAGRAEGRAAFQLDSGSFRFESIPPAESGD
jgi:alpha-L-rhamnosidase